VYMLPSPLFGRHLCAGVSPWLLFNGAPFQAALGLTSGVFGVTVLDR
jgi:hypothetical protein